MTLRLVHPAPEVQTPRPPKGRRSATMSLSAEEAQHFRAALRNIARAYGGHAVLAAVVGVRVQSLHQALKKGRLPSAILALRVAQAAGMHLETLLTGQLTAAGRCKSCGSRVGDKATTRAS